MKAEIVFVERIFPLYRKAVYDIIAARKQIKFFHGIDRRCSIEQTTAEYSVCINGFRYSRKESGVYFFLLRKFLMERPKIIVHEFSAGILSKPLLIFFCKLVKTKLIFWGHMYDRNKGFFPSERLADKYRMWLWRRADSLITYSQKEKELLISNKVPPDKIFVAFNTVDTANFLKVRNELEQIGRQKIKERLCFSHEFNLAFIGRLYKRKRPELLLELLVRLKQEGFASVGVHFIGDGEMLLALQEKTMALGLQEDVFFHGAIYDELKTGEMLFGSDLMVMPGCVGLSVNHSFCFNCPVVTFKEVNIEPAHGPEVEYVIDGRTGFLIADHSMEMLAKVVALYLSAPQLRVTMRKEVKDFIENECSIEKMAEGVISAIDHSYR